MSVQIVAGDAREQLRVMADESVHCIVTSPPYYGLRDYGTAQWEDGDPRCDHKQGRNGSGRADGIVDDRGQRNRDGVGAMGGDCAKCGARRIDRQIGLEPTPEAYVAELVAVFREARRVLRRDGTLWMNLGDSYNAYNGGAGPGSKLSRTQSEQRPQLSTGYGLQVKTLKPKDLIGIPWLVAFALRADGWWLRQEIIWHKPAPMPESVLDRCTRAHESLFLFAKSERYYFDAAAIAEPLTRPEEAERATPAKFGGAAKFSEAKKQSRLHSGNEYRGTDTGTRNKRSVWTVASEPFTGARLMRGASGDSYRKVSPDCPLHGDQRNPASSAQCGEPQAASRSARNQCSDGRPAPSLFDEPAPTETHRVAGFALDNSDLPDQSHFVTAIPHSTESHKTGHAPETSLHETSVEALAFRTAGSEPQPDLSATSGHIPESRSAEDCGANGTRQYPAAGMVDGSVRICTCEEYSTVTDHFAVFPPALIEPCILAGCPQGGTVLDPFGGAGTTGLVADRLGRNAALIELNPAYAAMARNRISRDAPLLTEVA